MLSLSFPYRFIRSLYSLIKGFLEDECYPQASALSYYTLLSMVPILAVAFGIAKGFGFEENLQNQILETFYQQKEIAEKIIAFAKSALDQAHGTLIAGVGVLFLFWSSLGLFGNLELAFNIIWKVPSMRPISKRIADFLPVLIFTPIFLIVSSSLTFFLIAKLVEIFVSTGVYQQLKPAIYVSYYILLLLITWSFFSFIYVYIPNRSVPLNSCVLAGFIAAVGFQILQWAYINFQIYLTSYNAIYGSFAAIPLFLLWLQISWLITLAGAEVAYQHATHGLFTSHYAGEKTILTEKELLLLSMVILCQNFISRTPVRGSLDLAKHLGVTEVLAALIIRKCLDANLIVETVGKGNERSLTLATDPDNISLWEILETTDHQEEKKYEVISSNQCYLVKAAYKHWKEDLSKLPSNVSLKAIVERK